MKKYGIKVSFEKTYKTDEAQHYFWVIHFDPGVYYENAAPRLFETEELADEYAKQAKFTNYKIEEYTWN
jgi:hypothetical protein